MKFRTILGFAAIAVVGIVGAAAIAVRSIDLADVRAVIISNVEAATGRRLTIDGELRFVLSLRPALATEQVALDNATWGSRPELIKLNRLVVEVELLPLLSGDIQVRHVRLEGADILLESDKAGHGNWEFDEPSANAPDIQATTEESSGIHLPNFNRIEVKDSLIVFHDGVTGNSRRIEVNDLRITANGVEDPINLALQGALDGQALEISGTLGSVSALRSNSQLPIDLAGQVGESELKLNGILVPPLDHRNYKFEVSAAGANLTEFGKLIGVDLPAWRNYSVALMLEEKDGVLRLEDVRVKVGQSDAAGHLAIDANGDRPRLEGALTSTLIDLSDLDESRESSGVDDSGRRIFSDKPLPYRWMNSFDGALTLAVAKMVKGEASFTDLTVDATLQGGQLKIANAKAMASGGTIIVSGSINGAKATPVVVLVGQAHQVDAGNFLQMLDLSDVLRGGTADIGIDVTSQGESLHEIMAGLAGTASWSMAGGAIDDDFARILLADLSGILRTGSGGGQLTCLAARFTAKAGVATTRGLVVDTPAASIFGTGSVDLGLETIKMRFDPSARQTSLAALAVPVDVTGPLADPSVTPDPLGVAGTAVGAASTVAGDVFDLLGEVAGVDSGGNSGGGCAMALDASAKSKPAKKKSTGEELLDDTDDAIKDIGEGIGDLFQ